MTTEWDASDQIVNSKSDLAAMVRTLTMQRDRLREALIIILNEKLDEREARMIARYALREK